MLAAVAGEPMFLLLLAAAALYLASNPNATPAKVSQANVHPPTTGTVPKPGTGSRNKLL